MSFFIVTLIVYAFYFNYSEPLKDFVGDLEILDMRGSGYELTDAQELLDFLGEEGRAFYVKTTLLDTVWPLLIAASAIFFCTHIPRDLADYCRCTISSRIRGFGCI